MLLGPGSSVDGRLWGLQKGYSVDGSLWALSGESSRGNKKAPGHPDFRHNASMEGMGLRADTQLEHKRGWADSRNLVADRLEKRCCEGELGEAVEALDLLVQQQGRYSHTKRKEILYCVLKKCMVSKDLALGRRVHAAALRSGFESNAFLATHFITMYAAHGKLQDAVQVFSKVAEPDAHLWASIILAYARHGEAVEALSLYRQMRESSSLKPDSHIFVAVLKACANAGDVAAGKEVHADVLESPMKGNLFVGNSLVSMYAKCGSLDEARTVFDHLPTRDVVTWTAMIAGYMQQGRGQDALALYESMQEEGMTPGNRVTFVCLLQACASVGDLHQGRRIHAHIRKRGFEADPQVGNCLVSMYAKCGSLKDALGLFNKLQPVRDVVTWNAMMAGYAQQGRGREALALYARMQQEGLIAANHGTFVCLLHVCASERDLDQGKQLHEQIKQGGWEGDLVLGNCLVDMYAKCGSLEDARSVFDRLVARDLVTWTTMLSGYAHNERGKEALALYASMQLEAIAPLDSVTLSCLVQACASVGALHQGRELHSLIKKQRLEGDVFIGSSLVDMYAKCGSLEDARRVFDRLPVRSPVSWTAMIKGYAEHCDGEMAIQCFHDMCEEGIEPDETTFTCLLVACSHAGLVDEGLKYYKVMVDKHGIVPTDYHYSCMVDLLGRSGYLDDAEDFLRRMPFEKDSVGWTSLLSACKGYGDVERGRRCFNRLVGLEPQNATAYVLLSTIYANAGRWKDANEIESLRRTAGAWKKPAKACIEVEKKVHEFTVGEERSDISSKVKSVSMRLKEEGGHVPRTELVLKTVPEQQKEDALCGHAEKLALAYGLLNTPHGTTLLVTKNLRMCIDCHSSTKILSRLEKREIVVRDVHRVHRFLDGSCSCGDRH